MMFVETLISTAKFPFGLYIIGEPESNPSAGIQQKCSQRIKEPQMLKTIICITS